MTSPHERLQTIRRTRGFETATDAARRFHWNANTYRSHENDSRPLSKKAAAAYAKAFKCPVGWLLYGEGDPGNRLTIPVVGYVSAGSETFYFSDNDQNLDEVEMPPGGTEKTVAVQVRGTSMPGIADDGWIIYYDDVRSPPTDDILNKLCVVRLKDGRTLVKRILKGRKQGSFDLWSTNEPPILDQKVEWAARVTWIRPQ